ncbi:MAG: DUF5131 family protein [Planctomycetia bacterium]
MNKTNIAWTNFTWNPMSGCRRISPGCKYCYAFTVAENKRGTAAFPNGFDLTLRPHKLDEPRKLKTPSLVFVDSMTDLFWDEVDDDYRRRIFDVIDECPNHQFQILTKRPDHMVDWCRQRPLPGNVWAGVTVENQDYAWRVDRLRGLPAAVRFLSIEPLLGPLTLDWTGVHWAIIGGESGVHLHDPAVRAERALVEKIGKEWRPRADRADWVRRLRDDGLAAGANIFFKQWGGPTTNAAGRLLDDRTWDDLPPGPWVESFRQSRGLTPIV